MSKKKSFFTILAMALICIISVAGTLAYLTATTSTPVTNTFTAAGGGKLIADAGTFTLKEHKIEQQDDGTYVLLAETTDKNDYEVVPGVNLPKDPFITITEKTDVPAYLYVEVVDSLADSALSYELDECWTELTGVTGAKGGTVYVYSAAGVAVEVTSDLVNLNILKDKQVVVDNDNFSIAADAELEFYGYLAQTAVTVGGVSSSDAADVYDACF